MGKLSECAMMEMFSVVCPELCKGGDIEILSNGVENCFLFGGPVCGCADDVHQMNVVGAKGGKCPGLVKSKLAIGSVQEGAQVRDP